MVLPDLRGKTVVITGASRGIGAGMAKDFHARGLRLALCSRSAPALPDGPDVFARTLDVADEAAVHGFARDAFARFGRLDLWINNAGVLEPIVPVRALTAEALGRHLDVNLFGVLFGCQAYLRHATDRQGGGVLINISSGAAWQGYAGWAAYCAGKAAVDRLSETLQLEEGARGVRVHAVAPGIVDTAMQALIRSQDAAVFPEVERFRHLKREEAFNSVAFVAGRLLAIAFDPEARPAEVVVRLPSEKQGP
jgi:NAD(P)-dependent dehydrogenase (short-subunit alcohol dehydrogenase family)